MKASINGPNRRNNRTGDKTVASDFGSHSHHVSSSPSVSANGSETSTMNRSIRFKVKSLETYLADAKMKGTGNNSDENDNSGTFLNQESIGDACLFTVCADDNDNGNGINNDCFCSGQKLLKQHFEMTDEPNKNNSNHHNVKNNDPLLIHFHEIPIIILRAIPVSVRPTHSMSTNISSKSNNNDEYNIIYLSQVHCHNNKICEDTIYTIRCCSRNKPTNQSISQSQQLKFKNYDSLSAIGIEVFLRYDNNSNNTSNNNNSNNDNDNNASDIDDDNDDDNDDNEHDQTSTTMEKFNANDISKLLINHSLYSVLTVNECLVIMIQNKELVCRVSKVCIDKKNIMDGEGEDEDGGDIQKTTTISAAEASLDDPYRGRIMINTEFYIQTSNHDAIEINGGRTLSEGKLPEDVIHVTTSDDEWFPVRRILLAPCIHLTKYVQHGKGIYKGTDSSSSSSGGSSNDKSQQEQKVSNRSPDAPATGIHCKVDIDCCTFDRVLVFIMSQIYPDEYKFALELSEMNALSHAANELGLLSLSDLCQSQSSSFASRVRKDTYISFSEIQKRNEHNELLIIIDGMVLDITRWIDEHPGGPSIIPTQALNIDCTCFFEMYHISKASFLYLKSFYIGELHPATQLENSDIKPSLGFLQSLRSYTNQWRVKVEEKVGEKIHKSL